VQTIKYVGGGGEQEFIYVMAGLVIGVMFGLASFYSFPDKATAFEVSPPAPPTKPP
jgi:hypothetical protein